MKRVFACYVQVYDLFAMATKARCSVRNAQLRVVKNLLRHNIILRPDYECQNRILNVKIRDTAPVRM